MVPICTRPGLSMLGFSALVTLGRGFLIASAKTSRRRALCSVSRRMPRAASAASLTKLRAVHPRNSFQGSYDMAALVEALPALANFIVPAAQSRGGRDTVGYSELF